MENQCRNVHSYHSDGDRVLAATRKWSKNKCHSLAVVRLVPRNAWPASHGKVSVMLMKQFCVIASDMVCLRFSIYTQKEEFVLVLKRCNSQGYNNTSGQTLTPYFSYFEYIGFIDVKLNYPFDGPCNLKSIFLF